MWSSAQWVNEPLPRLAEKRVTLSFPNSVLIFSTCIIKPDLKLYSPRKWHFISNTDGYHTPTLALYTN